jgi:hypothetical protein
MIIMIRVNTTASTIMSQYNGMDNYFKYDVSTNMSYDKGVEKFTIYKTLNRFHWQDYKGNYLETINLKDSQTIDIYEECIVITRKGMNNNRYTGNDEFVVMLMQNIRDTNALKDALKSNNYI